MTITRYALDDAPFKGRTGRGVRVAVVDSGIAAGHPHVGVVATGVSLVPGVDDTLDRIGHGTAVAAAIHEKAPGAELVPVKVFDRALKTDAQTLARAIAWAVDHGCRVINLSLGTTNTEHTDVLQAAVTAAATRGSVVVSAYESDGARWLPGSLEPAAGVLADEEIDRNEIDLDAEPGRSARVHASIYPRPIPGVPRERNLNGISFAVANASGFLARLLEGNGSPAGDFMKIAQRLIVIAICSAIVALPSAAQGVRVKLPAWQAPVMLDSMRQEYALTGKPEEVYAAVLRTFADLGIPTGNTDSKAGIIGSEKFEKMRQLAGAPLSRSYSCGESATGPNADSYRLSIAIVAWVKPGKDGGTTLALANAASGNDISGTYRNPRECASTGRIEEKIVEGVKKYVR